MPLQMTDIPYGKPINLLKILLYYTYDILISKAAIFTIMLRKPTDFPLMPQEQKNQKEGQGSERGTGHTSRSLILTSIKAALL